MEGYWTSPEAMERKRIDRWLRTARAIVDLEPRRKPRRKAGRARHHSESIAFRSAVREALSTGTVAGAWPRPLAALALDLSFTNTHHQPPPLWTLPKNYLDLLGATTAPADDPGPLLFTDDAQVKLLFVSRMPPSNQTDTPKIYLQARTRASAVEDMQLAGDLGGDDVNLLNDTRWAEADPTEIIDDDYEGWPASTARKLQLHDKSRVQAMILGSNDRLIRDVFFRAARWLLTGRDSNINQLKRRVGGTNLDEAIVGRVEDVVNKIALQKAGERDLLWLTVRIKLPPLPLQHGDGDRFSQGIQQAFRDFAQDRPGLNPLLVPLRVTVLVVPPTRHRSDAKDLDNLLIKILTIMEDELRPDAETADLLGWRQSEPLLWAYQVIELHRGPADPDEGTLLLIPGFGWNQESIWTEAEDVVEELLEKLTCRFSVIDPDGAHRR